LSMPALTLSEPLFMLMPIMVPLYMLFGTI